MQGTQNRPAGLSPAELGSSFASELDNFRQIAVELLPQPGETPRLRGIDVWGGVLPLNGMLGGDHIIYVDFKQRFDLAARLAKATADGHSVVVDNLHRCQSTAGIAVLDVSGHQLTDALMAAMLHQAFLLGAMYELDQHGQITKQLFENLNTRFYLSSGAHKYVSLLYGEVSGNATFRFISAGQPFPRVFSYEHDRFMDISPDLTISFPPIGILPSLDSIDHRRSSTVLGFKKHYEVNEWVLMGMGDILLLHTDGLKEHTNGYERYVAGRLEETLRQVKDQSAREIFEAIQLDLLAFGRLQDDITIVVVKRSS